MTIEKLVKAALNGNKTALEEIAASIQDNIYYLSLRMLADSEAAKDATQDILIKVITKLSSYRFDSQFTTWVYRIAANHLISAKKLRDKDPGLTFELYQMDLEQDLQESTALQQSLDYQVLLNELRISCTMAMLLCLNPAHRMAYILGDIVELNHDEASSALAISKANYRQQLSRARAKVIAFTNQSCGLVSREAKCRCDKKLTGALARKRLVPGQSYFADNSAASYIEVKNILHETQQDLKTLTLQQSIGPYNCPSELSSIIESIVFQAVDKKNNIAPLS